MIMDVSMVNFYPNRLCVEANIHKVYHLKAQFPGPSAPRDFVTCCITSHAPHPGEEESNPRHFTMISRPLRDHPETGTEKPGFVRGEYESIEFIRELSPRHPATQRPSVDGDKLEPGHEKNPPIEWIMVTRSNPGGSVPKWMVERGTPGSIVQDAEKFLNWVSLPRPELATPRPSQIGERPTEAEFTSGAPQRTISPEEADPEGQHEPTPGIVPATVSSVLSAIGSAASAVENVAAGAVHTVLGEGEKEEQPKEDVGRPSRPALARADTSVASFYSFEDESTEPGNRTPTPSSSTMSLNKEVVQAISQDEQAALERHLENEEKLKEKADREIEKVAKEAQAAAEAAAQKTQATTPLSETGSAQTDLSDAPPTKEQKKAIKLQWKLKERRQKVHERLQKDLAKEESRFQKEVEKIKKKHLKQAQKEKEHDESKKSSKQEAEVVAPSAEEEISSLESIASERHQFGGIRTPSIRSLARRKGDWANAEKEELRNVVKGLTLEVIQLRKRINELEDENRRLKGEEKAEDSGADLKSARSGEEVTVSFV